MNDIISVSYFELAFGREKTGSDRHNSNFSNDETHEDLFNEIDDDEYIPMTNEDIDAMFE